MPADSSVAQGHTRRNGAAYAIAWFAVASLLFTPMSSGADATPAQLCSAAKLMAVAKATAPALDCHAKGVAKDSLVDVGCLARIRERYAVAWSTAEVRGGCLTSGDQELIDSRIES